MSERRLDDKRAIFADSNIFCASPFTLKERELGEEEE
jgi:hypothetical protein